MEKTKLAKARKRKGLTQQQMADKLFVDVSNYNRREKGEIRISGQEWEKLAQILDVPIEDIYENEDASIYIIRDRAMGNFQCTNHIYTIPEHLLEVQRKYIEKLEAENKRLKDGV